MSTKDIPLAKAWQITEPRNRTIYTKTYTEILRDLHKPDIRRDKYDGNYILASSYTDKGFLREDVQQQKGTCPIICLDIDNDDFGYPNFTLKGLSEALTAVLGNIEHTIYSTHSATASDRRWRVLIPLAEPITAEQYKAHYKQVLLTQMPYLDETMASPSHKVLLPTTASSIAWYRYDTISGHLYSAPHCTTDQKQQQDTHLLKAADAATNKSTYNNNLPSHQFNDKYTVQDMAARYPETIKYYEISVRDEYLHTAYMWGNKTPRRLSLKAGKLGGYKLTAFDIYRLAEHDGDWQKAVDAIVKETV